MTLFSSNNSVQPACTQNVHRPMGGIEGLREVHYDVGRLTVSAFPWSMVKDMSMARAAVPACYILANHATAYIGETGNIGRRLAAVPEPGMPSTSIGNSAAVPEAWAAVSSANTPSMRPLPKLSGSLEKRLARL
jgi:hypothetical protein